MSGSTKEYQREYARNRYRNDPEYKARQLERMRRWREAHADKAAKRKRPALTEEERAERKREYRRRWNAAHKEERRENDKRQRERRRRERRAVNAPKGDAGWATYSPPTPRQIMDARVKPAGVSDVRWRMELSRRRLVAAEKARGLRGSLDNLPHPDELW